MIYMWRNMSKMEPGDSTVNESVVILKHTESSRIVTNENVVV